MLKKLTSAFILGSSLILGSCIAVDNSFNGDELRYPADDGTTDPDDPANLERTAAMSVLRKYGCFECHGNGYTPPFSSGTSDALFASSNLVNPDDPEASQLLVAIRTTTCADSGGDCDMPTGAYSATMSDEDFQKLIDWVGSIEP